MLIDKAAATVIEAERVKLLKEAMAVAVDEQVFLPLHVNSVIAATRQGLSYTPQKDENTNAMNLRKE